MNKEPEELDDKNDMLIVMKERNNSLLLQIKNLKDENLILVGELNLIENSLELLEQENIKLSQKIQEYQTSNKILESNVKEINFLLNNFSEREDYQLELEKLKNSIQDLKVEFNYKEHFYTSQFEKLKVQLCEYENLINKVIFDLLIYCQITEENIFIKEKLKNSESFIIQKEKEFDEIITQKDKDIKEVKSSITSILNEYELEQKSLSNINESNKKMMKDKFNTHETQNLIIIIREKNEEIEQLKIELHKMEKLKKTCFKLVNRISF